MRTKVQLPLQGPQVTPDLLRQWLAEHFSTEEISPSDIRTWLPRFSHARVGEEVPEIVFHACVIIDSIPQADGEQESAIKSAQYILCYRDRHQQMVWGLICVNGNWIEVRWKHSLSHALERATEHFMKLAFEAAKQGSVFKKVENGTQIPVREPKSTNDVYVGTFFAPDARERKQLARKHKFGEIKLGIYFLTGTILCLIVGGWLYVKQGWQIPLVQWAGATSDRLSTAFLATAGVSWLNYRFYRNWLLRRPAIDWNDPHEEIIGVVQSEEERR